MWKEELPVNCPPESAAEMETVAYRILKDKEPKESDFVPYVHLHPENDRYKTLCEAFALSSFDSVQNAIKAWKNAFKRGKNIGAFIARIKIEQKDGQNECNPITGHISTWLYANRADNQFKCEDVIAINEN